MTAYQYAYKWKIIQCLPWRRRVPNCLKKLIHCDRKFLLGAGQNNFILYAFGKARYE